MTTIETKIAKNGTKMYYVRDNETGKLSRISRQKAEEIEAANRTELEVEDVDNNADEETEEYIEEYTDEDDELIDPPDIVKAARNTDKRSRYLSRTTIRYLNRGKAREKARERKARRDWQWEMEQRFYPN